MPTIVGMPNSRATIAGWESNPPRSVTSAPTEEKTKDQAGVVVGQTKQCFAVF